MNTIALPSLCIVVPCYNEEETLRSSAAALKSVLERLVSSNKISTDSYICFVNDGSKDATWAMVRELQTQSPMYRGISLSRNFGHQGAVLAGLYTAEADIYVSIDADLQDDETKIIDMVDLYLAGNHIVYGCRDNRDSDTWFKRTTATVFYKLREAMGCHTIPHHADYRLMSARVVQELKNFSEVNLYLRGIIPLLGFRSACVYYERKKRELGESKYPLHKMLALAWNGVVNFSDAPLLIMIWMGGLGFMSSLFLMTWAIYCWLVGNTLPGWTSTVIVVSIFGSLQFLFMGIIGLYLGKIFRETKHRPHFIVEKTVLNISHKPASVHSRFTQADSSDLGNSLPYLTLYPLVLQHILPQSKWCSSIMVP